VLEYKIDFGPGYRIYFARGGETLLILLTGGRWPRQKMIRYRKIPLFAARRSPHSVNPSPR
jgi:putative addiction module killer protein